MTKIFLGLIVTLSLFGCTSAEIKEYHYGYFDTMDHTGQLVCGYYTKDGLVKQFKCPLN